MQMGFNVKKNARPVFKIHNPFTINVLREGHALLLHAQDTHSQTRCVFCSPHTAYTLRLFPLLALRLATRTPSLPVCSSRRKPRYRLAMRAPAACARVLSNRTHCYCFVLHEQQMCAKGRRDPLLDVTPN